MKRVLLIANSFGEDGVRYLYGISRLGGEEIKVVTLFVGGCSLYRHYRNMLSEKDVYHLYVNGTETGFDVSLKEALLSDEWDVVTFQQGSAFSGIYESYLPYLKELSAYVKKHAPAAKQYIHATWGWSDAAIARSKVKRYNSSEEMYALADEAYKKAAKEISADGYIPSTAVMSKLYRAVGDAAYKDGQHSSLGIGRYALALAWYMTLFDKGIDGLEFRDFDVPVSDEEIQIAERCAKEAVKENNYKKI